MDRGPQSTKPRLFTVAICTFNRADSLRKTLQSLVQMEQPDELSWELLVIDNNSSDHTPAVVEAFAQALPLRYLFHSAQGLSHARNRALKEFKGDYVVFTDDDVSVSEGWLRSYLHAVQNDDDPGYAGGPITPKWVDQKPAWLVDESMPLIGGVLGYYTLGTENRGYDETDMHPYGANCLLRKDTVNKVGQFRVDLGVVGETPGRGEEAEYFARVREAGIPGRYVARAEVFHRISYRDVSARNLFRYGYQKGVSDRLRSGRKPEILASVRYALTMLAKALYQFAIGKGQHARQCLMHFGRVIGTLEQG